MNARLITCPCACTGTEDDNDPLPVKGIADGAIVLFGMKLRPPKTIGGSMYLLGFATLSMLVFIIVS